MVHGGYEGPTIPVKCADQWTFTVADGRTALFIPTPESRFPFLVVDCATLAANTVFYPSFPTSYQFVNLGVLDPVYTQTATLWGKSPWEVVGGAADVTPICLVSGGFAFKVGVPWNATAELGVFGGNECPLLGGLTAPAINQYFNSSTSTSNLLQQGMRTYRGTTLATAANPAFFGYSMNDVISAIKTEAVVGPSTSWHAITLTATNDKLFPITDGFSDAQTPGSTMFYPRRNISNLWLQGQGGMVVRAAGGPTLVTVLAQACYSVSPGVSTAALLSEQLKHARRGNPSVNMNPAPIYTGYSSSAPDPKTAGHQVAEKGLTAGGITGAVANKLLSFYQENTPARLQGNPTTELEPTQTSTSLVSKIFDTVADKLPKLLKFAGEMGEAFA